MIDKDDLLDIIYNEEWAILQPKIDLANALAKIEELEEQIDHPDYYGDGDHDSPTFAGQREEAYLKDKQATKMIAEIDATANFFMLLTTAMSITGIIFIGWLLSI
tara:strand:+ start:584 stop:898 length:315 start_codon:yes stop_codon:yes gene_type:complete